MKMAVSNTDKKMLSRRGFKKYAHNPSIAIAAENQVVGTTRKILGNADSYIIKSMQSDAEIEIGGFYKKHRIDRTQFVKMYITGIRNTVGLSSAGGKVFEILYDLISEKEMRKPGRDDLILMHYEIVASDIMSRATFHRGITELLHREIIYESLSQNAYFVNIDFMFNGNRLTFISDYYLEKKNTQWIEQTLQLD